MGNMMNLESFLAELRAACADGVVFVLDKSRIRALGHPAPRCPLEVVCSRVTRREVPYYMVADLIGFDPVLGWYIIGAADADQYPWPRDLRDRLLEACGLASKEGK